MSTERFQINTTKNLELRKPTIIVSVREKGVGVIWTGEFKTEKAANTAAAAFILTCK